MSDWSTTDVLLLDPEWYTTDDYHEVFRRMRDEDPVHWTEDPRYGRNYWALTRYDDCRDLLLDDQRFSNRWDTHVPRTPKRMTPEERYAMGFDVAIPLIDNPLHDVYRRPFNKYFSVPGVARMHEQVDAIVDEVIAEAAEQGETDVVNQLGLQLPTKFMLRFLGIPDDDWAGVNEAVNQRQRGNNDDAHASHRAILDYSEELAKKRRAQPEDDFATTVVNMTIDGEPMSVHEARTNFFFLITAALGNTRNAISMGIWLLMSNPDQARLLADDPSLIKPATEEILRWASNSPTRLRVANHDLDLGGKRIRSGDWVIGFTNSANRDERQFPDPHRFDIRRTPNHHLGFGAGIHTCLGRHLARLEMAALLPRLFDTFDLEFTEEPTWGVQAAGARLPAKMPISLTRKRNLTGAMA